MNSGATIMTLPPFLSEIMPSCKCFPEVSKIAPLTYNRKQDEQRYYEERYNFEHYHPHHNDMPKSEEYVKRGESTLITTTDRVFSLYHSATISYHFDKIFTPNALEMTLLSNDVKCTRMTGHSWSYRLLNVKFTICFCEISSLMTENIKFTPF